MGPSKKDITPLGDFGKRFWKAILAALRPELADGYR